MKIKFEYGMRRNFHLEIGVGCWNFCGGFDAWINFLWWWVSVNIYRKDTKVDYNKEDL